MIKTKEWAESLGIATEDILPPVENNDEPYKQTAEEVAVRTIILHAVAAAGYGIDRDAIIDWLKKQNLWDKVSPREQTFLLTQKSPKEDQTGALWLQEAQWALLWTIQKVDSLGLPTKTCDSHRIVNEIMPMLGDDIELFVSTSELRPPSEIRVEDERVNKLYDAQQEEQEAEMPEDLVYGVLFQRLQAFKWLSSEYDWDNV